MKILGRDCELSKQLEKLNQSINQMIQLYPDGEELLKQIEIYRPDIKTNINALRKNNESASDANRVSTGKALFTLVRAIPSTIAKLVETINQSDASPAMRCAVVSSLAYAAQPRDILPDDTPGGYGFLDDAIMLLATLMMVTPVNEQTSDSLQGMQAAIACTLAVLPASAAQLMQTAVQGSMLLFQTMNALPPDLANLTTQQLLDNPLGLASPQIPAGWTPPFPVSPPSNIGHWSNGAYFEGNNAIFPGGASLIDGQVFIPS